ncbi:MAG: c-type cytochrome [Nitrospinota bacterium]
MSITCFRHTRLTALLVGAVLITIGFILISADNAVALDKDNGKKLYNEFCASCHGADGKSLDPGTPDFSMNEGLIKMDNELFKVIAEGIGIMPGYRGIISDDGIRDVILFMRFTF